MRKFRFLAAGLFGLAAWLCTSAGAAAQQAPAVGGTPAHLLVTVEPHQGNSVPVINRDEVMVYEGQNRDAVTDWVPAQGEHAALELFILIDDQSDSSLGSQLDDLRKFIDAQPPSTKVGVAYMQNGTARIVAELTNDHSAAAKSLRLPMGVAGANASPYFSLSDLVKRWPESSARREVLMISDGVDRYYGVGDLLDPYLQTAIDDAGRAGISVSAIYTPGAGHYGHSYWETYWGQLYLSELAEKTGGEAYYIGFTGPPVAFAPYLDNLALRLQHQYFLTFVAQPQKRSGWQHVRLSSEVPGVDLVSAGRVYVKVEK